MIHRNLTTELEEAFREFPIVFLTGPRQSGKTTLVKSVFKDLPYVLLENPQTRSRAEEDPQAFFDAFTEGAVLDEVQRVPILFNYLQGIVDENPRKRFVLTGSQNFLLLEAVSQSLAGRTAVLTLLPLSLSELKNEGIKVDYAEAIFRGSMPALYEREVSPQRFYQSYLSTYVERDVQQLINLRKKSDFNRFLGLCAGRIGQLLNINSLANDSGVRVETIKEWLSILEASYVIKLIQPWHENFNKRIIKSPKIYFIDTGLACSVLGIDNANQIHTHFLKGGLFENLIIIDAIKQQLNRGKADRIYFWRDSHGNEIDMIINRGDRLEPFEIKSGKTFNSDFIKNLNYWQKLTKKEGGTIVYSGDEEFMFKGFEIKSWSNLNIE